MTKFKYFTLEFIISTPLFANAASITQNRIITGCWSKTRNIYFRS